MTKKMTKKINIWFFDLFKNDCEKKRKPVMIFMFSLFLFMCLLYSFFLTQTISNTVAYQEIESEIPKINAELQKKKFEYILIKNDLNREMAEDFNLVSLDNSSVEYITRDSIGFYEE